MMNKFGLLDSDLETIIQVLNDQSKIQCATIFGSRAIGNYKKGSDIDIAVKGIELDFDSISKLSYWLNEETALPYKFDVLDYSSINEPALKEHIDRIGVEFYCR